MVLLVAVLGVAVSACGSSTKDASVSSAGASVAAGGSPGSQGATTAPNGGTGGQTGTNGATATTGAATAAVNDVTAGVRAAKWSSNVSIKVAAGTFEFVSDGIPSHELPDQFLVPGGSFTPPVDASEVSAFATKDVVTTTPLDVQIPLNPVYSSSVTNTNLGMIGVVISGAQLFNDYEDPTRTFVAVNDNFSINGVYFLDACNGHPLALNVGGGNYHYHGVPYCITDTLDTAGTHSNILGFLLDGFPFYGPQDVDGRKITAADLDECNGHVGPTPEFPNGIYHYHLKEDASPYTPDCYHGTVTVSTSGAGGPPGRPAATTAGSGAGTQAGAGTPSTVPGQPAGGGPPDLTDAAATLGVTVEQLRAALGNPPFDLVAAAKALGVSEAALTAALPPRPGGG